MAARLDNGDDDGAELHEINVTPFIDVMLVLLIIFMVAAPLSTVDIAVDLPVSTARPQPRPDKPVFLTIKADLSLALGNDPIPAGQLANAIDAATEGVLDPKDLSFAYGWAEQRQPRTMAGIDARGRLLLVTVDGRRPGVSEGDGKKESRPARMSS